MKHVTIRIGGMTCEHCVKTVRDALGALTGVHYAHVDLAGGEATVDFDEGAVRVPALINALRAAGYTVTGFQEVPHSSGAP